MPKFMDSAIVLIVALLLISVDVQSGARSDLEEIHDVSDRTETVMVQLDVPPIPNQPSGDKDMLKLAAAKCVCDLAVSVADPQFPSQIVIKTMDD